MSKNRLKLLLLALITSVSVPSIGASIDHVQNFSAEYGGNPAQQGAINMGSTVYFNPAGLMRLEDGTYIVGGVQYGFGSQSMNSGGKEYSTDLSAPPVPNLALYKKVKNGAYYWTIGGIGGGGELEYKNGIPLSINLLGNEIDFNKFLNNSTIKGSNMLAQTTLGRAFNLTDKWSVSLAVRGVYGKRTMKAHTGVDKNVNIGELIGVRALSIPIFKEGSASIDSEREAFGFGGQFGLNYALNDRLNIGFRYDTKVRLKFKTKSDIDDNTYGQALNMGGMGIPRVGISSALLGLYPVYKDGAKVRRDLPAIAALGASYKMTDKWTTFLGGNYYFNESASIDRVGKEIDYKNGWEVAIGSEYWFIEKMAWLVGLNYADTGAPNQRFSPTESALNSVVLGTGFKYRANEEMEWTFAFNHYIYDSKTVENIKYEKKISSLGINFVKKL